MVNIEATGQEKRDDGQINHLVLTKTKPQTPTFIPCHQTFLNHKSNCEKEKKYCRF